jgi:hypothetical protein
MYIFSQFNSKQMVHVLPESENSEVEWRQKKITVFAEMF